MLAIFIFLALLLADVRATSSSISLINKINSKSLVFFPANNDVSSSKYINLIEMRGGQVISGKKKQSPLKSVMLLLEQVQPATRLYLVLILICTIGEALGLPAKDMFALDSSRLLQVWRIFTSKAYMGFSMTMANNLYFLIRYGQVLERLNGTGYQAWFFFTQTVILSILGILLNFPFQAQALIAATVYCSCHLNPMELMQFQFEIVITSWQLPFALMAADCLSQQTLAAAWPHVLGIFSGHFFHFFTKVWPSLGGKAWLEPPEWFIKKFGGRPKSNVAGLNLKTGSEESKDKKAKRPVRPTGPGKKLGSTL